MRHEVLQKGAEAQGLIMDCDVQVPQSIRWAHGYNPFNTSLGMPCP